MTTPNTPIQFSEDDRQLLRQVLGIVQNLDARLSIVEEDKKYQTTPSLLNAFRHVLEQQLEAQLEARLEAHLKPIKEQLNKLEKEFRYYKTQTRLEIASLSADLSIVEERVGALETTNKS